MVKRIRAEGGDKLSVRLDAEANRKLRALEAFSGLKRSEILRRSAIILHDAVMGPDYEGK
jgi:hypothetical protein